MADRNRRYMFAAIALPFLFVMMSGLARATTMFVNTLDGENPAFPLCSITDAVTAHNILAPVNGCPAGSGNDSIFFLVSGTILLDEQLEIASGSVAINGPIFGCSGSGPCGITLDGEGTNRIIQADVGTTVTLNALTLADGFAIQGGAIFANGSDLEINDCLFRNNTAAPAALAGGFGGAIFGNSDGAITIVNSTFANNLAAHRGDPTVHNSGTDGFGGAIFYDTSSSVVKITNCTFARNTADVGTYDGFPAASMKGTILANNTGILENANCNGTPVDVGFNISDDGSCNFSMPSSLNNTNPLLEPLANNGGPTDTFALETSPVQGPAIARIPVANCTDQNGVALETDQRLFARPDLGNLNVCDSGAYEAFAVPPIVIAPKTERVQIARSGTANSDKVNMGFTFIYNGDPDCDIPTGGDEDALNSGVGVALFGGTCASLPAGGLVLYLDPFVVHTVNRQQYGTLFQHFGPETVSARMVALPKPSGACGAWTLNLEVAGLNTPAMGLGGTGPFALVVTDLDGDQMRFGVAHALTLADITGDAALCFDVTNAVVGSQTPPPHHGVRGRR